MNIDYDTLVHLAKKHNLTPLAVLDDLSALQDSYKYLKSWQDADFSADMSYMKKTPERFINPLESFPTAKTIMIVAISYRHKISNEYHKTGYGHVAQYARGLDYHKVLKKKCIAFLEELKSLFGDFCFRFASDAIPLLEKALAVRAGLGFIGQNTLLIRPHFGSYFFLVELFLDFEVINIPNITVNVANCGNCGRCFKHCSAFEKPYVLNAAKCVSYLTIEKRGMLPLDEREKLKNWIFGCDECQDVCPYNKLNGDSDEIFAEFNQGCGEWLKLENILKIRTHEVFVKQFAGSPIIRAKREGLVRNAAIVAANTKSWQNFNDLCLAYEEDESEIVRSHALWALAKLALEMGEKSISKVKLLLDSARKDTLTVKSEACLIEDWL